MNEKDDRELKIYQYLKMARIFCTMSLICTIIGIVFALIFENERLISMSREVRTFWNWFDIIGIIILPLILQAALILQLNYLSLMKLANKNNYVNIILLTILISPIFFTLILMLLYPFGYCLYLTGYVFNLGIFAIIAVHILMIMVMRLLLKERKERIKSMPQYIAPDSKINETNSLLSKTGKNFFVKYYFFLKNWENMDILDEIQENYEDATKKSKIEAGKKIFSKELNIVALKIIANASEEAVNAKVKTRANEILNQEKKSLTEG